MTGRYVEADLDRDAVVVTGSSTDRKAEYIPGVGAQKGRYEPMRFPWTVSLTDPLLLYVIASTDRCYCTWRANIRWRSGGESGVLAIDNGGRGYRVAGTRGVREYVMGPSGWSLLRR